MLTGLAKTTPLEVSVAAPLGPNINKQLQKATQDTTSATRVQQILSTVDDALSLQAIQQLEQATIPSFQPIIDYLLEWESTLVSLVEEQHNLVKQDLERRNHYEVKLEKLRKKHESIESQIFEKGEGASPRKARGLQKLTEKLSRNQDKTKAAVEKHEASAGKLCTLIHQACHHVYRDLYPLLDKYMRFRGDAAAAHNELSSHQMLSSLENTMVAFQVACSNTDEEQEEKEIRVGASSSDRKLAPLAPGEKQNLPEV
jgi:hypothetical protein